MVKGQLSAVRTSHPLHPHPGVNSPEIRPPLANLELTSEQFSQEGRSAEDDPSILERARRGTPLRLAVEEANHHIEARLERGWELSFRLPRLPPPQSSQTRIDSEEQAGEVSERTETQVVQNRAAKACVGSDEGIGRQKEPIWLLGHVELLENWDIRSVGSFERGHPNMAT